MDSALKQFLKYIAHLKNVIFSAWRGVWRDDPRRPRGPRQGHLRGREDRDCAEGQEGRPEEHQEHPRAGRRGAGLHHDHRRQRWPQVRAEVQENLVSPAAAAASSLMSARSVIINIKEFKTWNTRICFVIWNKDLCKVIQFLQLRQHIPSLAPRN